MSDTTGEALRLKALRKSYNLGRPNEVEVLHGLDLTISRNDFAALIGPSGSGKSTLLNVIGLLDKPSSGELICSARRPAIWMMPAARRCAARFQYRFCVPVLSFDQSVQRYR